MRPHSRLFYPLIALALAGLACTFFPGTATPDPVATRVAETLAAAEEVPPPSPTPDRPEPTGVPDTAPPPTPTATPLPRRYVYTAGGNVKLWTEGGSPSTLTSSGDAIDVRISDDGQVVGLIRKVDEEHEELWAVNADGSNLRVLVSAADFDAMTRDPEMLTTNIWHFDFVPGSHSIAYNTLPVFDGPGLILNDDLRLVDADTASLTTLLSPGQGGNFVYSPDGSQIAVSAPSSISLVNADGTGRREILPFSDILTYSEYQFYPRPVWTPDGTAVRVIIPPHAALEEPTPPSKLWHIPTAGSSPPTELFSFTAAPLSFNDYALSPNAQRVAYMQPTGGDGRTWELHLANADGSGDTAYDTGQLNFEAWSPDGNHFIYSQQGENPQIGQVGSAPQAIPGTTRIGGVEWVNSTQYLYTNRDSGARELWLGELGATNTLIDSTSGNGFNSDFTP